MLDATTIKNIKDARKVFRTEYEQRVHTSLETKIDEIVQLALQNGESHVKINTAELYNHIDKHRDEIILGIKEDYEMPDDDDFDVALTQRQSEDYANAIVDLAEADQATQESILPYRKESVHIAMKNYANDVPLPATVEGFDLNITL